MKKLLFSLTMVCVLALFPCNKLDVNAKSNEEITFAVDKAANPVAPVTPPKITGLVVDNSSDYAIHWDAIPGTYKYEVFAVDSLNNYYYAGGTYESPKCYEVTETNQVSDVSTGASAAYVLSKLYTISSDNKKGSSPVANQTYTICVRAVNAGLDANGKISGYAYGEVATVSYKMPSFDFSKTEKINNFSYEGYNKDNNRFYFAIPEVEPNTTMILQVSKNSSFYNDIKYALKYDEKIGLFYIENKKDGDKESFDIFEDQYVYLRTYCPYHKSSANNFFYSNAVYTKITDVYLTDIGSVSNLKINDKISTGELVFEYSDGGSTGTTIEMLSAKNDAFTVDKQVLELKNGRYSVALVDLKEGVTFYFKARVKREINKVMWSTEGESKESFTNRAKTASGKSDIEILTPFPNTPMYCAKYPVTLYGSDSNTVTYTKSSTCSIIKKLSLEQVGGKFKLNLGGTTLASDEKIQVCWSVKNTFPSGKNKLGELYTSSKLFDHNVSVSGEMYIELPPITQYVRARVIKSESKYDSGKNTQENYFYSAWSNTVSAKSEIMPASISFHDKTNTSVTIYVGTKGGVSSGVEIQQYKGSSFSNIYSGSDPYYTVTGLTANTSYTFRARRYYYDLYSKKKIYSDWVKNTVVTWGKDVTVRLTPKSSTSIQIDWTNIYGAQQYELYRVKTEYNTSGTSANRKFSDYELIKTFTGSTRTYVDKGVTPYSTYSYLVRAKRTISGKAHYVTGEESIYIGFDKITIESRVLTDGRVYLTWKPVIGATNYYIEKYNHDKGGWAAYKTLDSSKSACYLPKCVSARKDASYDMYRIRAGKKGGVYSSFSTSVYVYSSLAIPTKVTAKRSGTDAVLVTWEPVAGADYYIVYRTKSSYKSYDSTTLGYKYSNAEKVVPTATNKKSASGFEVLDDEKLVNCKIVDRKVVDKDAYGYQRVVNAGPGVGQVYYFVVACRKVDSNLSTVEKNTVFKSGASDNSGIYVFSTQYKPAISATVSTGKIKLSWKEAKDGKRFEIYRAVDSGKYSLYKIVTNAKETSFVDTNVVKGKKYSYKMRIGTMDLNGQIVYTNVSDVKTVTAK